MDPVGNVGIYMRRRDQWVPGLIIPRSDFKKFSETPLKWLLFACFCALGTKGDLFDGAGPEHSVVNYNITSVTDMAENYYFIPDGDYHVVDDEVLSAHHASVTKPIRNSGLRDAVAARDGNCCVVTGMERRGCEAAHIIPHSKGDDYISFIFLQRGHLYGIDPATVNIGINSTKNGTLLRRDMHGRFGQGESVFLKTPNFALEPADIPLRPGEALRASCTTVQHFVPYTGRFPVPQTDILADWSTPDAPPSILLDFMYRAAVIKNWATDVIRQDLLREQRTRYSTIISTPPTTSQSEDDTSDSAESNNTSISEYVPSSQSQLVDRVFLFREQFKGSPGFEATMRRKANREKVEGWLHTSMSYPTSFYSVDGVIIQD